MMRKLTLIAVLLYKVHSLILFGSQGSRSPLVKWYLYERGIEFKEASPFPSNHPFQQVPFLKDGDCEVFESGAILLYLADKFDKACTTAEDRARYTKWIVWANSALDPICFVENERGGVIGTRLDQGPKLRALAVLDNLLSENDWLVDQDLSVADIAVASYLNYVPLFIPMIDLSLSPHIARYMAQCARRDAFISAFGQGHTSAVLSATERALNPSLSLGKGEGGRTYNNNFFGGLFQ
mmetsp:Transcript_15518/g.23354  ORF Transcript_15518/g.23354 Transcript_15518/m.23354 type:complete len:238 (+) Transcript_15518:1556-2269(+)